MNCCLFCTKLSSKPVTTNQSPMTMTLHVLLMILMKETWTLFQSLTVYIILYQRSHGNMFTCTDNSMNVIICSWIAAWFTIHDLWVSETPPTAVASMLIIWPWLIHQDKLGPAERYHKLATTVNRMEHFPLGCSYLVLAYGYYFVWRRHKNMPQWIGSRV